MNEGITEGVDAATAQKHHCQLLENHFADRNCTSLVAGTGDGDVPISTIRVFLKSQSLPFSFGYCGLSFAGLATAKQIRTVTLGDE